MFCALGRLLRVRRAAARRPQGFDTPSPAGLLVAASFLRSSVRRWGPGSGAASSLRRAGPPTYPISTPICRIRSGCCARPTTGHASDAQSPAMNSRLCMRRASIGGVKVSQFLLRCKRPLVTDRGADLTV